MTDRDIRQIKVIVIAGIILAICTGMVSQALSAWRVQNQVIAGQTALNKRLDDIADTRQKDALRQQMNAHDMATVIDVIRDTLWVHQYPGKSKPYTPLALRIPDVPPEQKYLLNHHIGDIPLMTDGNIK
jgi:cytochrome c-type biogenesis protein CcmH/NrfG